MHASSTKDMDLGKRRIAEAKRLMPVMTERLDKLAESSTLKDLHIGSALFLDPKSAYFLLKLKDAGARITALASVPSVDKQIVLALSDAGILVLHDTRGLYTPGVSVDASDLLAAEPDVVLDEGGLIRSSLKSNSSVWGIVEHLSTGLQDLTTGKSSSAPNIYVVDLSNSRLMQMFDNYLGVGQSSVMAFLDITNLQLGGRSVLVYGFGDTGRGVAKISKALGAKVTVTDSNPIQQLCASFAGYRLASMGVDPEGMEIVFITCDASESLPSDWFEALPDSASICVVGDSGRALSLDQLENNYPSKTVRDKVRQYTMPNGHRVHVIGAGLPIHKVAGEGNPIEIMDMTFSLQAAALKILVESRQTKSLGSKRSDSITIPAEIEECIAKRMLDSRG